MAHEARWAARALAPAASVVYVLATCFSQPRKLVTDMNVQAFFQQTSSRVLYTMTSKAHGYGVEEAITSSEGSDGGGAYTTHWMSAAARRRRRRLSCQIPHEWNCCQQLPNASLSFLVIIVTSFVRLTLLLTTD